MDIRVRCDVRRGVGHPSIADSIHASFRLFGLSLFEAPGHAMQLKLVDFLFKARKPGMRLETWIGGMLKLFLREALTSSPSLVDEAHNVQTLLDASKKGNPLGHFTVETLSRQGRDPDRLFCTTLHSAKGLEFNAVIIPGLEDGAFPHFRSSQDEIAEARRLFYVGLTRAKAEVHLMYSKNPSIFVKQLRSAIALP